MTDSATTVISKVYRLAGGILAETEGAYYLVGELKEPCHFDQIGFEKPADADPDQKPKFIKLNPIGEVAIPEGEYLEMETQGEKLAELLFKRFVILRNYSVSDRLWRAATAEKESSGRVDARWLEELPEDVWDVVRDSLLRCV